MPLRSGPPPIRWPERERRPGRTAASHVRKKRPGQGTGSASRMNSIGVKARIPGLCRHLLLEEILHIQRFLGAQGTAKRGSFDALGQ